jgi:RNA recognition motif-containing protein
LNYECDSDDLWHYFSRYGEIIDIRIAHNPSGSKKGFCHIEFADCQSAQNSTELHGSMFAGREIKVDLAQRECANKEKFSPHSQSNRNGGRVNTGAKNGNRFNAKKHKQGKKNSRKGKFRS